MPTPLSTKFDPTTPDDEVSLFRGEGDKSITLAQDLSDSETEVFYVSDATGAPTKGYAVIDDELIAYGSRFGIDQVRYLQRAQGGTTAASHTTGATVELMPKFFIPPAWQEAILAMQAEIINLRTDLDAL